MTTRRKYQRVLITDDRTERLLRMADDAAKKWPDAYEWFLSRCKRLGMSAGREGIVGEDAGLCMLWYYKVKKEHPEIKP